VSSAAAPWLIVVLFCPAIARAHSGAPAYAKIVAPAVPGVIADRSFEIQWEDSDSPTPSGPASIDFFYTKIAPLSLHPGETPEATTSTAIAFGISEPDLANRLVWDTSSVAPGHYWIWSVVREPPQEVASIQITGVSPAPIAIRHDGADELGPALAIVTPEVPNRVADRSFVVLFWSYVPSGTALVRTYAEESGSGRRIEIAESVEMTAAGLHVFDTRGLGDGEWMIGGTITDDRGRSFEAHAPFFLTVFHSEPEPDAGSPDAPVDAGADPDAEPSEAGALEPEPTNEGCGCSSTSPNSATMELFFGLVAALGLRARTRAAG
jgi:hypothetical protein